MKPLRIIGIAAIAFAIGCGGGSGSGGGTGSGAKSPSGEGGGTEGGGGEKAGGGGGASEAKFAAPPVGAKALEQHSASLEFELTLTSADKAAGGLQAGKWSLDEERSFEVLGSKGPAITGLKVVFGKREAKPLLGVELTAATASHTYSLEAKGGGLDITRSDGGTPSSDETEALKSEFDWVGSPSPLMKWIDGGELADGKTVQGGSTEARALLSVLQGIDYSAAKVSATSKGKTKSDGREMLALDVTANVRLKSGPTYFDFDLKGPAKIDLKTGWVAEISLAGPVKPGGTMKHKKGELNVTGKGTATVKRTLKF